MFLEPQLGGNFLMPGFASTVHPQFTSDLGFGTVDPIAEPYIKIASHVRPTPEVKGKMLIVRVMRRQLYRRLMLA
jgi:hypothetical protein